MSPKLSQKLSERAFCPYLAASCQSLMVHLCPRTMASFGPWLCTPLGRPGVDLWVREFGTAACHHPWVCWIPSYSMGSFFWKAEALHPTMAMESRVWSSTFDGLFQLIPGAWPHRVFGPDLRVSGFLTRRTSPLCRKWSDIGWGIHLFEAYSPRKPLPVPRWDEEKDTREKGVLGSGSVLPGPWMSKIEISGSFMALFVGASESYRGLSGRRGDCPLPMKGCGHPDHLSAGR
jgi:hypothetical protein